jgi:hypothetical protein
MEVAGRAALSGLSRAPLTPSTDQANNPAGRMSRSDITAGHSAGPTRPDASRQVRFPAARGVRVSTAVWAGGATGCPAPFVGRWSWLTRRRLGRAAVSVRSVEPARRSQSRHPWRAFPQVRVLRPPQDRTPKAGVGSSNLPRRTICAGQSDVDRGRHHRDGPLLWSGFRASRPKRVRRSCRSAPWRDLWSCTCRTPCADRGARVRCSPPVCVCPGQGRGALLVVKAAEAPGQCQVSARSVRVSTPPECHRPYGAAAELHTDGAGALALRSRTYRSTLDPG